MEMKRKLIEQGGVTLMLSLPREWIKKFGLKRGDEVDIASKDKDLLISVEKAVAEEKSRIEVTHLQGLIHYALSSLYVRGVDELTITSDNSQQISTLQQKPINQFVGFEIIDQTKNKAFVKDLSGMKHVEFNPMVRRVFLLLENMYDELAKGIEANQTNFNHIVTMDLNVNRFCFLSLRILNKKGYEDFKHTQTMFLLVTFLEQMGDLLKEFAEYISTHNIRFSDKQQEEMKNVAKLFSDYHRIFFKFNIEKATKIDTQYRTFHKEFDNLLDHTKSGKHMRALMYLDQLANLTAELLRTQLMMVL